MQTKPGIYPTISASQVLYCLAKLEDEGVRFYKGLLAGTKSKRVRALAEMMMRAEKRHQNRFLQYAGMAETAKAAGVETGNSPLPGHVASLLNKQLYASRESAAGCAGNMSDIEVIKKAIQVEEESAQLLTELRNYVPQSHRAYVTRVINEELNHKALLEQLMTRHFKK